MALVAAADQGFIQLSCISLMNATTLLQSHAAAIHTSHYYVVLMQATWVAFNNLHIQFFQWSCIFLPRSLLQQNNEQNSKCNSFYHEIIDIHYHKFVIL